MITISLTFALALLAAAVDLKPLPEERKLAGTEQIALEFARFDRDPTGVVGWSKTTVDRGEIDGVTHFVVQRLFEAADFETPSILVLQSRGLYDADLNLVREVRTRGPLDGDVERFELEWGDDGFRWREGRGRWSKASDEIRPTTGTDVALYVHGLSVPTPWTGQVFDLDSETIEAQTLQPPKDTDERTSADLAMKTFDVEGATPMRHFMSEKGVYMRAELEGVTAVGVDPLEGIELVLRRELADDELFENFLNQTVPRSWTQDGNEYSSAALGMTVELSKGWKRSTGHEIEGTQFHALSADGNAYVSFTATPLGSGYTLEVWSEGIIEHYEGISVGRSVKTQKVKVAKQEALRLEFVQSGANRFDSTAFIWKRHGMGFLFLGGTWTKSPKKLQRETRSALDSVEFAR